jgi:hypothetical protein
MKHLTLFVIAVLLLTDCQTILMKMYGIKNPDIENEKSIIEKAKKYDLDITNIVTVNSKDFLATIFMTGIPDATIYDKQGKYIEYRQTDTSCNAGLFQFIPELKLENTYNKPDSLPLNKQFEKFRDLKGNKLIVDEKADFYVLIYWVVWAGKLNKDHVKIWEDLAKNNKHCSVKVFKVNLDIQEYWDKNEQERIIKIMNKKK